MVTKVNHKGLFTYTKHSCTVNVHQTQLYSPGCRRMWVGVGGFGWMWVWVGG